MLPEMTSTFAAPRVITITTILLILATSIALTTQASGPGVCRTEEWEDSNGNSGKSRECVVIVTDDNAVCVGYHSNEITYANGNTERATECDYELKPTL